MISKRCLIVFTLSLMAFSVHAQEPSYSTSSAIFSFPGKLLSTIDKKANNLEQGLDRHTVKYMNRLTRQEQKLYRKLKRKDTAAANRIFGDADARYTELGKSLQKQEAGTGRSDNAYSPHLDSISTALAFLHQNGVDQTPAQSSILQQSVGKLNSLQRQLNNTEAINRYLQQRKQFLQQQLGKFGLAKELKKYKRTIYYYRAQVDACRKAFDDPSLIEARVMQMLSGTKVFRSFFSKYSMLGSLFRLPGDTDPLAGNYVALAGLQARQQMQQQMQQRFGASMNTQQMAQRSVADGMDQLKQVKDKLNQLRNKDDNDPDMPDFKPNSQKTKSFFQRLELGSDIQSVKSNSFFPATTDIAASLGYKFSDKTVAGIGVSYKMGWGKDIRHISISHQGVGLRTFLDAKLKWNFWLSGGGELNYRAQFRDFSVLKDFSPWQKSALAGLTKKYKVGKKNARIALLYDFLWKQQVPQTQQIVMRVGYSL